MVDGKADLQFTVTVDLMPDFETTDVANLFTSWLNPLSDHGPETIVAVTEKQAAFINKRAPGLWTRVTAKWLLEQMEALIDFSSVDDHGKVDLSLSQTFLNPILAIKDKLPEDAKAFFESYQGIIYEWDPKRIQNNSLYATYTAKGGTKVPKVYTKPNDLLNQAWEALKVKHPLITLLVGEGSSSYTLRRYDFSSETFAEATAQYLSRAHTI